MKVIFSCKEEQNKKVKVTWKIQVKEKITLDRKRFKKPYN